MTKSKYRSMSKVFYDCKDTITYRYRALQSIYSLARASPGRQPSAVSIVSMSEHDRTSSSVQLAEKEFHIAPMLDVSTIEFRYFMRLLTKRAVLWTEMVVAETLVHRSQHNTIDDTDIQLDLNLIRHCGWFDERDYETSSDIHKLVNPHPITCQIGTNNPSQASFATRVVQA